MSLLVVLPAHFPELDRVFEPAQLYLAQVSKQEVFASSWRLFCASKKVTGREVRFIALLGVIRSLLCLLSAKSGH